MAPKTERTQFGMSETCDNRSAARAVTCGQTVNVQFPTPQDPGRAPVWDNYVTAQAAAASLGLIPTYAHAVGVEVRGLDVQLVIQQAPDAPESDEDVDEILGDLETLLGPDVSVSTRLDIRPERRLRPDDGVRWFYAARVE
jgi:hypothetical protein